MICPLRLPVVLESTDHLSNRCNLYRRVPQSVRDSGRWVWMLPTVVMAVPPSDKPAATGIRGIHGWLRHGLSRGRLGMLPFGMSLDTRASTQAQSLGLGGLVAFSAKGLPAESPSPRDSGQATPGPCCASTPGKIYHAHACPLDMGVFWPQTRLSSHLELKPPP